MKIIFIVQIILYNKSFYFGVIILAKIKCSVCSCAHNLTEKNECTLNAIQVCPCKNTKNGTPEDETCCSSYAENRKY